jgi:hypothetical protein
MTFGKKAPKHALSVRLPLLWGLTPEVGDFMRHFDDTRKQMNKMGGAQKSPWRHDAEDGEKIKAPLQFNIKSSLNCFLGWIFF